MESDLFSSGQVFFRDEGPPRYEQLARWIQDAIGSERLHSGDRLVLVTDGVTEAENAEGEFFDNERLELAAKRGTMAEIFAAVSEFCGSTPLSDDCTVVEMTYSGE